MALPPALPMPMPGPMMHDPLALSMDLVYTAIIFVLSIVIFLRTHELYDLTKHKGIGYLRQAFLLFGLAYAFRFLFRLISVTGLQHELYLPRQLFHPTMFAVMGVLSTLALFYLAYSTGRFRMRHGHFLMLSVGVSVAVSAIAFLTRSPFLVFLFELALVVAMIVGIMVKGDDGHRRSHARPLYLLIALFWLLNLVVIGPLRWVPAWAEAILFALSLGVFFVIYSRVHKWTR
ncbi:hypothetical protein JXB02_06375 [Candidatus Woesearchaeota archaeon]|nr:hypothetical protein [Candidatus Woesearchaeota archaeon]